MTNPYLLFAATVAGAGVLCVGAGVLRRVLVTSRGRAWRSQADFAAAVLVQALSRPGAAVLVGLAGLCGTIAVMWPLGWLARGLESAVDVPALAWAGRQQGTWWAGFNATVTVMGNNRPIQLVILLTAVPLAVLWRRRGWWIPAVVAGGAYVLCRTAQTVLENVIDRDLPPTSGGDYPSGGVGRTIAVYGSIMVLSAVAVRARPALIRRLVGLAVVAGAVEAYTRVFLQKHWLTDSIAGMALGVLVLGTVLTALWVLQHGRPPSRADHAEMGDATRRYAGREPARIGVSHLPFLHDQH